jgi:hypothetical protein
MAIKIVSGEDILQPDGSIAKRCVLISGTTPDSLTIDGGDVEGMNDGDVIAAGSVLITPDKNYIAFTDGAFTEKE